MIRSHVDSCTGISILAKGEQCLPEDKNRPSTIRAFILLRPTIICEYLLGTFSIAHHSTVARLCKNNTVFKYRRSKV